jgi:branched-chain amino acid transport system ATP-binding protein
MSDGMTLIEALEVTVRFGGVTAVRDATLGAASGQVTGLIGPNGAGKTTLFNVINGLQTPTSGVVRFSGEDITDRATHERARRGIARTFQRLEAFGSLSVWENVLVAVEIHRQYGLRRRRHRETPAQVTERIMRRVGLDGYANRQADTVPTGIARLLELARALALNPRLLLLDEPSAGLNTTETGSFGALLRDLAYEGKAVLLVEHDMELIMRVCDRIHVLNFGEVIASGTPALRHSGRDPCGRGRTACVPGASGMRPILELVDVTAAYGRIEVLHGVSLALPKGTVMALLGPNGAGKTTLLKVASGQLRATAGHVHLGGSHVNDAPSDALARAGLCTIPEGRSIFPNLTVAENLRLTGYAGLPATQVFETAFERFPLLAERANQLAGSMSGGEQQMLAMARALATNPAVLLVDELSMGLAPLIVRELYEVIASLAAGGVSVLVVEQFADAALAVADRAAVLVNGRVVATGRPDDVTSQLSTLYLGGAV